MYRRDPVLLHYFVRNLRDPTRTGLASGMQPGKELELDLGLGASINDDGAAKGVSQGVSQQFLTECSAVTLN